MPHLGLPTDTRVCGARDFDAVIGYEKVPVFRRALGACKGPGDHPTLWAFLPVYVTANSQRRDCEHIALDSPCVVKRIHSRWGCTLDGTERELRWDERVCRWDVESVVAAWIEVADSRSHMWEALRSHIFCVRFRNFVRERTARHVPKERGEMALTVLKGGIERSVLTVFRRQQVPSPAESDGVVAVSAGETAVDKEAWVVELR